MMRQIKGWTGLRTAVIALGLVAWTATGAKADPLLTYSTAGQIDPSQGVTGSSVVSFNPISSTQSNSQAVDLGAQQSNVSLGTFVVTAEPGQTTTYNNTPFSISFVPQTLAGQAVTSGQVILSGVLNGTVSGSNSTVQASFNQASGYPASTPNSPFTVSNGTLSQSLSFNFLTSPPPNSQPITSELLASPSTNNGQTTAQLEITTNTNGNAPGAVAAPEPSAIALFLTTVGGLGLRRYIRARRRPA
jgi:hypothetical protein